LSKIENFVKNRIFCSHAHPSDRSSTAASTAPLIDIGDGSVPEIFPDIINDSDNANLNSNQNRQTSVDSRAAYELLTEQSVLLIEDGIICRDIGHKMRTMQQIQIYRSV